MILLLLAAVLAVGGRLSTLVVAACLATLLVTTRSISYFWPALLSTTPAYITALAFCIFVVVNLLRFVLRSSQVNTEVLCAGIAAYMLIGLAWSAAYLLAAKRPGAFAFNAAAECGHVMSAFDAFYFSLITLTTVGYGDITPVSRVARMLAATEAMIGLLYVAVVIARLVAMYTTAALPGFKDRR
jgi:hypothetical protein